MHCPIASSPGEEECGQGVVKGTIISLEGFAPGAAPITLVDGETLLDLLIERIKTVELLELDLTALVDVVSADENPQ